MILTLPIAVWQLSFGVYMTVEGFKPSAVTVDAVDDPAAVGLT